MAFTDLTFAGYAAGTAYYAGTATAGAGASCSVPASTSATLLDASGKVIATNSHGNGGALAVAPAERLAVTLTVAPPCGLSSDPRRAQIAMVGGTTVTVPIAASGQPHGRSCALPTATVTFATSAAATASPAPQVEAAITVSGTATRGASFAYAVTLTNTASGTWSLDPCPAYDEGIKIASGYSESHMLNCAAAAPIAPGGSETFDMSLSIPADAPAGPSLLTWSIEGEGSGANARITIN